MPSTHIETLRAYADAGFKMIRVSREQKNAVDKGWQRPENTISLEDARTWVERGENVGIQCGEQSGGLAVVECDSAYARELAERFLPPTLWAAKAGETVPAHHFFIAEGAPYRKVKDVEQGEILSLKASDKGKGHYVVVEPSVHPTKGQYVFMGGFDAEEITRISADELEMQVGRLGAAALVAEYLPAGGRHDYALALTGFMLRNDEDAFTVLQILRTAWIVRGALSVKAEQDLEDLVEDTRERLGNNEPVTGGKTLNELVGGPMATRLSRALGWTRADEGEGQEIRDLTDLGNAERFLAEHGEYVRYIPEWGTWAEYDGSRWRLDIGGLRVGMRAGRTAKAIFREAGWTDDDELRGEIFSWAKRSAMGPRLEEMVKRARGAAAADYEEFDSDPWLLNCPNGTVDLRTGDLREHDAGDLLMKSTAVEYDSEAEAPRFHEMLVRVLPNARVRAFVHRLVGYALVGTVDEQVLPFFYGTGANGKSTFLNAVLGAIGEYGQQASQSLLMAKQYDSHPTEIARLFRARLVVTTELDNGRRLAEATVKQLTGGDRVEARRMREDFWEFDPTHTMIVAANHRPEVQGTDKGIWRRIKVIPWEVSIPEEERDPGLHRKLGAELPGILAWIIKGALDWQRVGLAPPPEVEAETEEYREEMDVLAGFIADECVEGPGLTVKSEPLYIEYKEWCQRNGQQQESQTAFSVRMRERGFEKKRKTSGMVWRGIGLRGDDNPTSPGGNPTDPTSSESVIPKRDSADNDVDHVGYDPNSGLTARNTTRDTGVNREKGTDPTYPTSSGYGTLVGE